MLLPGGRTAHSTFKIPISLTGTCNIKKGTNLAKEIKNKTNLIIWDEAVCMKKEVIESVDTTLRDICECNKPFGGIITVFSGDFRYDDRYLLCLYGFSLYSSLRQTLPVVQRGNRAAIVDASIKRSQLWSKMRVLSLKDNIRCSDIVYANFLIERTW